MLNCTQKEKFPDPEEYSYEQMTEEVRNESDVTISIWAFSEKQVKFLEVIRFYDCLTVYIDKQSWKVKALRGFEIISPQVIEESLAFR